MLIDATACPQDTAYPTDLNLLNDAREKSEELIGLLYDKSLHGKKPRTYRRKARKLYLGEAQERSSTAKAIRKANGKQLAFLRRNLRSIDRLLDSYQQMPLNRIQRKCLMVINLVKLTGVIHHALGLSAQTFSACRFFFLKKVFADDIPKNIWGFKLKTDCLAA